MKKSAVVTLIILGVLIASSIAAIIASGVPSSQTVLVFSDGKCIKRLDLSLVTEPYELQVKSADGGTNTLLIENGRICVKSADCPDKTCVNSGWLNGSLPIICIPHRLEIRFEGSGDSMDGVSR